jgi:predicted PurR-regulated permease PerM
MIMAKNILIPLAVSVFLTYLLYPLVNRLEKSGIHRIIASVGVVFLAVVLLGSVALLISIKISNMTIDLADIRSNFDHKTQAVELWMENRLGMKAGTMDNFFGDSFDNILVTWQKQLGNLFTATTTTIFQIVVLPVFTFFLLFYRTKIAYFIFRAAGRKNKAVALKILREVSTVATRYMGGILIVVAVLCVLNSTGLYIMGIKYAIILGVLSAIMNLIPYVGTVLGGLIPFSFVLFTYAEPFPALLKIVLLFAVIQFTENYILTPNIVGSSIKINPLAIILSLLFASMVWGIAGMLIVVPFLAILKVIMRNVDSLKPYAYLLSDRGNEKYKVRFPNLLKKIRK